MNEPQLDQKIHQDVTRVKENVNTLKEDGINKFRNVSQDLEQPTEDVTAWVNSGVALLSNEFEKVKGDATETVAHATTTVKKNVGNGLSQYNDKVAEVVNKLPGDVAVKAGKYPWVAISFALMFGFLLRGLLVPRRHRNGNSNESGCTQNME